MKQLITLLLLIPALTSYGQNIGQNVRIWWPNARQIAVQDSGQTVRTLDAGQFAFLDAGANVNVVIQGAGRYYPFAKVYKADGTAYSTASSAATIAAIAAAGPGLSGGGSGGTGGFNAASFGTAPPVATTYTGSSGTIATTGTLFMLIENTGSAAATITYAGVVLPLAAGASREFRAQYDYTTNKLVGFATMSLNATGTTVILYKYPTQ